MIKVIRFLPFFLFTLLLLTGCGDFLEESSQDEVRPSSASDLEQLLLGEGYQLSATAMPYLDMLTDDVKSQYTESSNQQEYVQKGQAPFTWDVNMFEQMEQNSVSNSNSWQEYYQYIKGCNVVLDYVDELSGTEAEKGNVKGQALGLRAYYYFMLCNLFAKPYNYPGIDLDKEPGVPLVLKSAVKDDLPARASLRACYDQIEKDLKEAEPLMEAYGQNNVKDKVTAQFVHHLLARLYLYEERWDDCIAEATTVLNKQPGLLHIVDYGRQDSYGFYTMHVYHPDSPELIWCYSAEGDNGDFEGTVNGSDTPAFLVSDSLVNLYDYHKDAAAGKRGDYRAAFFYNWYNVGDPIFDPITFTMKVNTAMYWGRHNYNSGDANKGFRTAEDYLNRAESYIHKFIETGNDADRTAALADLNTLRKSRWDGDYTDVDIKDGQELLKFYKDERRRELAFDDHRWFDLRRYGEPSIQHVFTLTKGNPVTYTLTERDNRYTLQIPQKAIDRNSSLVQNPR